MKKITLLSILILPLIFSAGCAKTDTKSTQEPVKDESEDNAIEATLIEPSVKKESSGDIDQDIKEIDSLIQEDEADVGDDSDISDKNLGI